VKVEDEPHHHLIFANHSVRALAVEIPPRHRTLCHQHNHDYLLYVAADAEIISAERDEEPVRHSYRDGNCEVLKAGLVHVVENLRDVSFRNVVVELMPGIDTLHPGRRQRVIAGDVRIRELVQDERLVACILEMSGPSEVEVWGPAVFASPYEQEVELLVAGTEVRKLSRFRDLLWLKPGDSAALRRTLSGKASVLMCSVGGLRS
jgi:hypothetical protein